jgi:hypothetical protein
VAAGKDADEGAVEGRLALALPGGEPGDEMFQAPQGAGGLRQGGVALGRDATRRRMSLKGVSGAVVSGGVVSEVME